MNFVEVAVEVGLAVTEFEVPEMSCFLNFVVSVAMACLRDLLAAVDLAQLLIFVEVPVLMADQVPLFAEAVYHDRLAVEVSGFCWEEVVRNSVQVDLLEFVGSFFVMYRRQELV